MFSSLGVPAILIVLLGAGVSLYFMIRHGRLKDELLRKLNAMLRDISNRRG